MKRLLYGLMLCCFFASGSANAQNTQQPANDEATIRQLVAKYAEAFNKADAKALADMWSPDAVYTNRVTGESVQGRAAIGQQFEALFTKAKGLKLSLQTDAIQFLSPNVAVEHGTATFVATNAAPEENHYTAIYVKRDGQWLMDRVTDDEKPVEVSNYEHLKSLEWMIGSWTSDLPVGEMQLDCEWTANRNFITRKFSLSAGQIEFSGFQIIGWDPQAKAIRSWTFDAKGTFAEGTWTNKGKQWFIHNKGVLADGASASMVNVMKVVDDNSFTWQTIDRTAGGELLPNIDEVLIVRQ